MTSVATSWMKRREYIKKLKTRNPMMDLPRKRGLSNLMSPRWKACKRVRKFRKPVCWIFPRDLNGENNSMIGIRNSPATYLCPKANNEWKSREHDGIECTGEVGRCYVWYTPLFKKRMNNQIKLTLRYLTLKSSEKRTLIGIKSVAKSEYLLLINWSNGIYFKLGYKHEILKCNVTHCRWIAYKGCTCTFW